ncbi:hypothetical protein OA04_09670 [Pectobacterium versatile]|nr:hypothetical protein OA04_09670 [Pectobacterium versatile]MBD0846648.1 hypothetical protein [Pectobacterium carotovorum subsp. carotovorum]TAI83982.1 hypothetical protein EG331_17725 [Pectobacterium versatile]
MPLLIKPTALQLYSSYFKRLVRWLPLFPPVTYLSKLLGIHAVAAFTPLELFRVYIAIILITSQKIFRFLTPIKMTHRYVTIITMMRCN